MSEKLDSAQDGSNRTVNVRPWQGEETMPSAEPGRPRAPSEALGRYRVTGKLGAGGMGEVLQVFDERLGREMAAKVLLDSDADDRRLTLFVQEAQITGQLEHPNIVPLYELGLTEQGQPYFTMKRIEGRTLAELLEAETGAGLEVLLRHLAIFSKVCDAIAFAHSRGVIHRDLKPSNVMVGAFGEVQVCDWGLAKVLGASEDPVARALTVDVGGGDIARMAQAQDGSAPRTLDGDVLGTPAYMSPEQARGEVDRIDARSDIYSLGALLYVLLSRQRPYSGSPWEMLDRVARGRLVPPSQRTPEREIPWELEAVVMRAMHLDPVCRYPSVGALAADVQAFVEGRLLAAARYTPTQRVSRWVRRRRLPLVVVGLLLAAGLAGAVAVRQRGRAQRAELARQEAQTERDRVARARALEQRIAPLEATMQAARPYLYLPRIDIAPRLAEVRGAIEELEKLTGDPVHSARPRLWLALARGRLFLDQPQRALAALEEAGRRGARPELLAYPLGRVHLTLALRATLAHDRARSDQHLAQAGGWLAGAPQAPDPLSAELLPVFRLLAANEKAEAARLAERVLARHPNALGIEQCLEVIARTALVHRASPDNQRVIAACTRALRRRPHRLGWAHALRGHARMHQGDYRGAAADLTRAIAEQPDAPDGYHNRAWSRELGGDLDGALADYGEAIRRSPRMTQAWTNRGNVKLRKGDIDGAIADHDQAIRIDARCAESYDSRGIALREQGKLDRALADHDRAIALAPRDAEMRVNRGRARHAKGDVKGAIADYTRAIALAPGLFKAWANRANVRKEGGDLSGALADYDKAISLAPRQAGLWTSRGVARLMADDPAGAIADHRKATQLDPRLWLAWANLGIAHAKQGQRAESIAALTRAQRLAPPGVRPRLEAMLRRLRGK